MFPIYFYIITFATVITPLFGYEKRTFLLERWPKEICTQYICSYNGFKVLQSTEWCCIQQGNSEKECLLSCEVMMHLFVWYFNITNRTHLSFWTHVSLLKIKKWVSPYCNGSMFIPDMWLFSYYILNSQGITAKKPLPRLATKLCRTLLLLLVQLQFQVTAPATTRQQIHQQH